MSESKVVKKYGQVLTHYDLGDFLKSGATNQNALLTANNAFLQIIFKLKPTDLLVCIRCAEIVGVCTCPDQFSSAKWVMPVSRLRSINTKVFKQLSPKIRNSLLAFKEYWAQKTT